MKTHNGVIANAQRYKAKRNVLSCPTQHVTFVTKVCRDW